MIGAVVTFQAITGVEGTGDVGTVTFSMSVVVAISGVDAAGSVGTITGYGWGVVPDSSESWTPVSDTSENWSDLADNSITWQEAA